MKEQQTAEKFFDIQKHFSKWMKDLAEHEKCHIIYMLDEYAAVKKEEWALESQQSTGQKGENNTMKIFYTPHDFNTSILHGSAPVPANEASTEGVKLMDVGLGICVKCKQVPATKDYNGHKHYVCDVCFDRLEREFEDEYD